MERVRHNPRPVTLTTYFAFLGCFLSLFLSFFLLIIDCVPASLSERKHLLNCVPRFEDHAENEQL